jgi:hypothetical protein
MNGTQVFDRNLDSLVRQLGALTGLTLKQKENPIVRHLIAAKTDYHSNERRLACARATYAKLAIEDLQIIAEQDPGLLSHFKKKLHRQLSLPSYFGLRLEIRIAASLVAKAVHFQKSEAPDFVLTDWQDVGIECTSAHLDLKSIKRPDQVVYKVGSAIENKNKYKYTTRLTILALDVSNLLFHEGQEQCLKVLADKDRSKPMLEKQVNDSVFQSLLYFGYTWEQLKEAHGVRLLYGRWRIDRNGIVPTCKDFLDFGFPFGDMWILGGLFRTV